MRADGSSRMNLLKTFTNLSDGKHVEYDFVETISICAFRLVPEGTSGNMMIDGEKVPHGKLKLFNLILILLLFFVYFRPCPR